MRLPSYTTHDEKEFLRSLTTGMAGSEIVMGAEEYLNPGGRIPSQQTLNTPVGTPSATSTQKFFPPGMTLPGNISHRNSTMIPAHHRDSRYGSNVDDRFSTWSSRSLRQSNMFSASCDPIKHLEDVTDSSLSQNTVFRPAGPPNAMCPRPPTKLPVDDEGYLEPSPKSPVFKDNSTPTNNNAYMDLLCEQQPSQPNTVFQYPPPHVYLLDNQSNYGRVPDPTIGGQSMPGASIDNLEYQLLTSQPSSVRGDYHTLGIPIVGSANNGSPASSQGPSSIHSVTSNPPNSGKPPSLTSNGSSSRSAGLNGVILKKHDEGHISHEYYNDFGDRFNSRGDNMKPLKLHPPPAASKPPAPASKHETTV